MLESGNICQAAELCHEAIVTQKVRCEGRACALPESDPLSLLLQAAQRHAAVFRTDGTYNLVTRLHHNVIRAGLRRINLAYSRISLQVCICNNVVQTKQFGPWDES